MTLITAGLPDRCSHGHPYTTANTLISSGRRTCRQCNRERQHHTRTTPQHTHTHCPHHCGWTYVGQQTRANIHLTDHLQLMHHGQPR